MQLNILNKTKHLARKTFSYRSLYHLLRIVLSHLKKSKKHLHLLIQVLAEACRREDWNFFDQVLEEMNQNDTNIRINYSFPSLVVNLLNRHKQYDLLQKYKKWEAKIHILYPNSTTVQKKSPSREQQTSVDKQQ